MLVVGMCVDVGMTLPGRAKGVPRLSPRNVSKWDPVLLPARAPIVMHLI